MIQRNPNPTSESATRGRVKAARKHVRPKRHVVKSTRQRHDSDATADEPSLNHAYMDDDSGAVDRTGTPYLSFKGGVLQFAHQNTHHCPTNSRVGTAKGCTWVLWAVWRGPFRRASWPHAPRLTSPLAHPSEALKACMHRPGPSAYSSPCRQIKQVWGK